MTCTLCHWIKAEFERKLRNPRLLRIVFWTLLLILLSTPAFWTAKSAYTSIDPALVTESWEVVNDGLHNAFTDLIFWNDDFYLVYRSAHSHIDAHSKLVVLSSPNARSWEKLAGLALSGGDVRDPKLAIIGNRLFLYALKNVNIIAWPDSTVFSTSEDGKIWLPWQAVRPQGWLFGRPRTPDGLTWYVAAYSDQRKQTALFQSKDGKNWEEVSVIYSGEHQSEAEIIFTQDGSLAAVIRLEGQSSTSVNSTASTLIASARPPYLNWSSTHSYVTRMDGPVLFTYGNSIFAAGRSEPENGILFGTRGGLFNKKRTSIFWVSSLGLKKITDLPSEGDTSYPGIVIRGDEAYLSYYTNDIHKDLPWLLGQFSATSIRIAKLNLPNLEQATTGLP